MELTIRIKQLREQRSLTQQELADMVGVSKPHISALERGKKNLNNHLISGIAAALGVQPYELFTPEPHDKFIHLASQLEGMNGDQLDRALEFLDYLLQKEAS